VACAALARQSARLSFPTGPGKFSSAFATPATESAKPEFFLASTTDVPKGKNSGFLFILFWGLGPGAFGFNPA
jgi:hypothetical protein